MKKLSVLLLIAFVAILTGCANRDLFTPNVTLELEKTQASIYTAPFKLSGGSPEGGIYSGEGVYDGKFYPEKAKYSGSYEITYTVNEVSATDNIVLKGLPRPTIDPNCTACHGSGYVACPKNITCGKCNGSKKIFVRSCSACGGKGKKRSLWTLGFSSTCSTCYGSGSIYTTCPECEGRGWLKCPKCRWTGKIKCPKCNK